MQHIIAVAQPCELKPRQGLALLHHRQRIRDDVESGAQKQQRDYFLRKQLESIRKELGEDEGSVVDDYRRQIEEAGMPDEVREQAERELEGPVVPDRQASGEEFSQVLQLLEACSDARKLCLSTLLLWWSPDSSFAWIRCC